MSSISAIGLGIHHKNSDPELARSVSSPIVHHHSTDKMSPALRGHSTLNGPTGAAPPTPPPQIPLPPPPASAAPGGKVTPAHLNGNAPSSPRIGGTFNLETSSPHSSPSMRPSRAGSINSRVNSSAPNAQLSAANVVRRERDSTSSNVSEPVFNAGLNTNGSTNGHSNGWASPTGSTMSVSNISAATAQALQGVEVNELRGVVDTLAHQVQALKVEQAMQQGKIQRLEAALAEAEERLKVAQNEKQMTQDEKVTLAKEIEKVQAELTAVKLKSEKDRQELESILEKERREREKAVEARAIMEAKMEELMGRKKNSGLMSKIKIKRWSKNN
ncbi:hypothetical protein BCR41DRAFT_359859 [Lobosporangium transversale]|uniref:Uncharacterized protein n=1 Tax=Lobosporangium transversale TaxID=64571 RepID=A0A1Y2GDX2_9FUNG|nr:hypothetical protein BCR41DRAFT_359859 [Lobosporangium transversale]ORZ08060.1 hypothetical protein BCR41DRAFT_359859 [Lobosporangium transversale]|eukprot:XP_021878294.1 hypothetical protein BCR41DRAFT_359859 [Lobosporangium transversale]